MAYMTPSDSGIVVLLSPADLGDLDRWLGIPTAQIEAKDAAARAPTAGARRPPRPPSGRE